MVMLLFVGISAVATALIAWFNWQLVNVTNQMHEVTERSLRSDRPYLVFETVDLVNFAPISHKSHYPVNAAFSLRNWGKGAAVEVVIRMRLAVVQLEIPTSIDEAPLTREQRQPHLNDVDLCWPIGMKENTIPVGPRTSLYEVILNRVPRRGFLSDEEFGSLIASAEIPESGPLNIRYLALHGAVTYRDFIGNSYELRAVWQYNPVEKPGMPIGFYNLALRDIVHPVAANEEKNKN
jgi:hypothetical protein